MLQFKQVWLFLAKAIIVYSLLLFPFSFESFYGKVYRSACSKIFKTVHHTGFALFIKINGDFDTKIQLGNDAYIDENNHTKVVERELNSRYFGYMTSVLFISLVLSTPFHWKRKIKSMIVGLFLVTLFALIKQWIDIEFLCFSNPWLKLYEYSHWQKIILQFMFSNFVVFLGTSWLTVVIIWFIVSFRSEDMNFMLPKK